MKWDGMRVGENVIVSFFVVIVVVVVIVVIVVDGSITQPIA